MGEYEVLVASPRKTHTEPTGLLNLGWPLKSRVHKPMLMLALVLMVRMCTSMSCTRAQFAQHDQHMLASSCSCMCLRTCSCLEHKDMYLCHVPALELVLKLRLALRFVHVCVHVRECSAVFFLFCWFTDSGSCGSIALQ